MTSTIKLLNMFSNTRLHSHDVKYGTGSGQQSVTAVKNADDHNSYWQIKQKPNESKPAERGDRIKCGDVIRLFHLSTKRYLHSHLFVSPLSNNQEVSAFGENGDLTNDENDNWIVDCDETYWRRDESVRFKHELTKKYLHISGDTYGRPIQGQYEVSCYNYPNQQNLWKVLEGIYIKPNVQNNIEHNEL
jgi:dolichyl-phosphate-mannose--protein O-mannosyl transferase